MIDVVFICLGNICRSPMAEALLRHKVQQAGLSDKIRVDSAGTEGLHSGARPHRGTARQLQQRNIDFSGIVSRQINAEDIENADYLIVMDLDNYNTVRRRAREWGFGDVDDIRFLLEFASNGHDESDLDVPDPYYTRNFDGVYEMIDDATEGLLEYIRKQEGI
ncbi:MAG: low molecular weight phosphotyrosine protein phosphatase [Chloroflexota bacterium]|nr:low molecular weight phosphotyrosine protein phosphatase [Chloroflexota bacterium]